MYYTDLVLPEQLEEFDHNRLSKFDYYIFVVVASSDDLKLAITKIGPLLAACDALCFLVNRDQLQRYCSSEITSALFDAARTLAPKDAVSFIASISRKELHKRECPKGHWFELFLSLEKDEGMKEAKLREGIQKAMAAKPTDFAAYGPFASKVLEWCARLLLRGHP